MITENQIKTVKRQLNLNLPVKIPYMFQEITPEQTYKGLAWLIKQKSLKTSPFNDRENYIIDNFAKFMLIGFNDSANKEQKEHNVHWFVPVYRVVCSKGLTFSYYYDFMHIHILG